MVDLPRPFSAMMKPDGAETMPLMYKLIGSPQVI